MPSSAHNPTPCAFGLVAATVALMTSYAQPEPGGRLDPDDMRRLIARKIIANLAQLRAHPNLPQGLCHVMAKAHAEWSRLDDGTADRRLPGIAAAALH